MERDLEDAPEAVGPDGECGRLIEGRVTPMCVSVGNPETKGLVVASGTRTWRGI